MRSKVEALLHMKCSKYKKQEQIFTGGVNFYQTMWPWRTHVLAPLTYLQVNVPFCWGLAQEKAWIEMKAIILSKCMSYYLDLNISFEIYTNVSYYQLRVAIIQLGHPFAYWSQTLSASKRNFTRPTTMSKRFPPTTSYQPIIFHQDTCNNFNRQRMFPVHKVPIFFFLMSLYVFGDSFWRFVLNLSFFQYCILFLFFSTIFCF